MYGSLPGVEYLSIVVAPVLSETLHGLACAAGKVKVANREYSHRVNDTRREVRSQRSEVRSQRSEVRGQKSEVRGQRSEVRGRKDWTAGLLAESDSGSEVQ